MSHNITYDRKNQKTENNKENESKNFEGCEIKAKGYAQLAGIFFFVAFISEIVMIAITCSFIKETTKDLNASN